jgi:hypothetical protein
MLVRAGVDLLGDGVDEALHERGQGEHVVERRRQIAHAHFDGAEIVVRAYVPPDLADRVDESRFHEMIDEPHVLAPVAHQRGQACGGQVVHELASLRLQPRRAPAPERTVDRQREQRRQVVHDALADEHGFLSALHADVEVDAERD